MDNKIKNPLLAGLMNVVLPGASQLYVNHNWSRFVGTLVAGVAAFVAAVWVGNLVQGARGYFMAQGVCMGLMLMAVFVVLFLSGHKTAQDRNAEINTAAYYNSKRMVSHDSHEIQHAQIQKMHDEGLISKQEFDEKNAKVNSKE